MLQFWHDNHSTKVLLVLNTSSCLVNLLEVISLLWALPWSRNSCMVSRFPRISLGKCAFFFEIVIFFVPREEFAMLSFRALFLTFLPRVRLSSVHPSHLESLVVRKPSVQIIDSVLFTVIFSFFFCCCFVVGFVNAWGEISFFQVKSHFSNNSKNSAPYCDCMCIEIDCCSFSDCFVCKTH